MKRRNMKIAKKTKKLILEDSIKYALQLLKTPSIGNSQRAVYTLKVSLGKKVPYEL